MNTTHFKWLVKREYWENKGGFFWAPTIISALMVIFLAIGMAGSMFVANNGNFFVDGDQQVNITELSSKVTEEDKQEIAKGMMISFVSVSVPLLITFSFVVFFYCISALYDDRRDRSILFWKSLPASDGNTVLSKVFSATVIAPIITIVFSLIVCYIFAFMMMGAAAYYNINVFGLVLGNSSFYTAGLGFFAVLPVYILWALPTIGYLLMVSAWAKRVPFVWAVGIPVIGATMVSIVAASLKMDFPYDAMWAYVGRLLLSVVPGSWFGALAWEERVPSDENLNSASDLIFASYSALSSPHLWIGVVAGIAMIFVAIKLRKYRDEG
jgi:ABC-2 type transport system permease protein